MSYLKISIDVSKGSMMQSIGIISPAPIFACVMAMHALDKELAKSPGGAILGVEGVGIIHRDYKPWVELLQGKSNHVGVNALVQQRGGCLFGNDGKKPAENSLQPAALADYELEIILKCRHDVGDVNAVRDRLLEMRLAGGVITNAHITQIDTWDNIKVSLHGGFWVDDASDEISAHGNPVDGLVSALLQQKGNWIMPATLGYALIEPPAKERKGARDGLDHAFAEHMIGLVRFVPMRIAKKGDIRLWRYGWSGDQFLVTNRPNVILNNSLS